MYFQVSRVLVKFLRGRIVFPLCFLSACFKNIQSIQSRNSEANSLIPSGQLLEGSWQPLAYPKLFNRYEHEQDADLQLRHIWYEIYCNPECCPQVFMAWLVPSHVIRSPQLTPALHVEVLLAAAESGVKALVRE